MSKLKFLASISLTVALAVAVSACAPEEYGVCSIPNTSATRQACTTAEGENAAATCVVKHVFDCDSLLCGRYNSSDPYCTYACKPTLADCKAAGYDGDKVDCGCPEDIATCYDYNKGEQCPDGGTCVEWTKGTSAFYCVKPVAAN